MNILTLFFLVIGLALLVVGAEILVKSASKLAATVGVSPLIIGLTVVALGTSAPELAISLKASLSGQADLGLGNVIGSNICNILFILGISALISPLIVAQQLIRLDVPIMIGITALLIVLGSDGTIGRLDGAILFVGGIAYTAFLLYQSRQEKDQSIQSEYAQFGERTISAKETGLTVGLFAIGVTMLVSGSQLLVDSAVKVAEFLGASPLVIGITVVAFGTSLPELATSVTASIRGERDIAVGNVIGSNIFNILVVLGLTGAVSKTGVAVSASARTFDMPVMMAVAIICLPICFASNEISRRDGALLLAYYLLYISYVAVNATNSQSHWAGWIAIALIPLTLLTLILLSWRTWSAIKRKRAANRLEKF